MIHANIEAEQQVLGAILTNNQVLDLVGGRSRQDFAAHVGRLELYPILGVVGFHLFLLGLHILGLLFGRPDFDYVAGAD